MRLGGREFLLASALALVGLGPPAATLAKAQVPPRGIDPAVPDFLRRDLQRPQAIPQAEPRPADPLPAESGAAPAARAGFILRAVRIDGAAVLPDAVVAAETDKLIGQTVSLGDLQALADRLSARYRALGYVLSQVIVPAQRVENGVVTLKAIEGFVDGIEVTGGTERDRAIARSFLAAVPQDRPFRIATIERGLLLTRDTLSGTAESIIGPSPTTFGAADVTVPLEPRLYEGFASIDNRGSNVLGPWIARFGASLISQLGRGERFDFLYATSPGDDALRFGQVVATLPLLGLDGILDGAQIQVAADHLEAQPLLSRAGLNGFRSEIAESQVRASLIVPLIRTRPENLYARGSVTWRDSEFKSEFGSLPLGATRDRLLIFEPRVTWDFADRFDGVSLFDVALRAGVGSPATKVEERFGRPDFLLLQGTISRLQRFGDSSYSALVEFLGQWSRESLPVSERFAIGGERLGRGYGPGNTTGDSGIGARLELRAALPMPTLPEPLLGTTQLYCFLDWGAGIDRSIRRDGDRWEALGSSGAGARIDITQRVSLNPEIATQIAGRPADIAKRERETRATVSLVVRF